MVERQVDLLLVTALTVLPVLIVSVSNLKKYKNIVKPIFVSSEHRGKEIGDGLLSFWDTALLCGFLTEESEND